MQKRSKAKYSAKQERQVEHIVDSEKKSGRSTETAQQIAWATVNKKSRIAPKKPVHRKTHKIQNSHV